MSVAYVQKLGASTGVSGSITITSAAGTQGDTVIVAIYNSATGATLTVSDDRGNAYTVTEVGQGLYVARAYEATALHLNDHITVSGVGLRSRAVAMEVSGMQNANTYDTGTSATGSSTTPDSGGVSPADTDSFLVGMNVNTKTNSVPPSCAPGTGWTEVDEALVTSTAGSITTEDDVEFEYRVISAGGTYDATGTLSASSAWKSAIAVYSGATFASYSYSPSDTGLIVTDTLARGKIGRALADTGLSVGDSVASKRLRPLTDSGMVFAESMVRTSKHLLADTGLSISMSLATPTLRRLTDTGLSISESTTRKWTRLLVDAGLAVSDSVSVHPWRKLADTGVAVSDSLRRAKLLTLTDRGCLVTDSTATGVQAHRSISDVACAVNDTVATSLVRLQPHQPRPTAWLVGVGAKSDLFK